MRVGRIGGRIDPEIRFVVLNREGGQADAVTRGAADEEAVPRGRYPSIPGETRQGEQAAPVGARSDIAAPVANESVRDRTIGADDESVPGRERRAEKGEGDGKGRDEQ